MYQRSKALSKYIYALLQKYPKYEMFALCDQIRRAVTSVPINIAEGFGRFSSKEKSHFLQIAFGSLTEVMCEIELSFDNGYITLEEFNYIEQEIIILTKQLSKLNNSIKDNGDYNPQRLVQANEHTNSNL